MDIELHKMLIKLLNQGHFSEQSIGFERSNKQKQIKHL